MSNEKHDTTIIAHEDVRVDIPRRQNKSLVPQGALLISRIKCCDQGALKWQLIDQLQSNIDTRDPSLRYTQTD